MTQLQPRKIDSGQINYSHYYETRFSVGICSSARPLADARTKLFLPHGWDRPSFTELCDMLDRVFGETKEGSVSCIMAADNKSRIKLSLQ